ncbi:anthranilate 1,2-dioxygenase large subunit AndAc [uncultured Herbaspirillum sp.]|uniref:anthranilate 1,2-dioxygenase large subunit AndAc n=1 Tax=uncultured Herbaspirillum sp. TaxID=160236 RepID=UPI002618F934|nr:anthranilate 1,2-dioxygenase large subunit AndAc [uncultured Herbaspirillum sp.]
MSTSTQLEQQGYAPLVQFPRTDGARTPYKVFSSKEVYDLEQERIYRGQTWSFLALEAEIPNNGDYKSTFVGDTPVVVTRTEDGTLAAWVNKCSHRGAIVCRTPRGNASSHSCAYHQWSFDARGNLLGVPFRRGQKGATGMAKDFDPKCHGLRQLRVDSYKGLVFATFSETVESLPDYIGAEMRPWIDRIFHKPIVYLGCTRQYSKSNWKLYLENVKDPYHASLLHLFHTTFNIFRVGMKARSLADKHHGLHSIITATKNEVETADAYKQQEIRSFDEGFSLQDPSVLGQIKEFEELTTNHIQPIFPQLVVQQIHNTLVARQLLPKGPSNFELVFHFFGYEDDTPELRALRIKQANLVGPAGYISMEDTEATELVQRGTARDPEHCSVIDMARDNPDQEDTLITESLIRKFWMGYQKLMGFPSIEKA